MRRHSGCLLELFDEIAGVVEAYFQCDLCDRGVGVQKHRLGFLNAQCVLIILSFPQTLTKAAIYGHDANWGRILCALGYAGVDFDPVKVDISLKSADGVIEIVKDGIATDYSEDEATKVLSADAVTVDIDVHNGVFEATAWGCDLTHDYVTINADYRS